MHWRVQQGDTSKFCLINCPQLQIAREQNHWNMTSEADRRWHFHYISGERGTTPGGGDSDQGASVLSSPPPPATLPPRYQSLYNMQKDNIRWRGTSPHIYFIISPPILACETLMLIDGPPAAAGTEMSIFWKKIYISHFLWLMKVVLPSRWHAEEALHRYCLCWRFQNCHLGWTHGWRRPLRPERHLGTAAQVQTRYLPPFCLCNKWME